MTGGLERLHVRPVLRFAFEVEGRATVFTKRAAYRGACLAAISKRCDCYHGTGAPDDPSEICEYHAAVQGFSNDDDRDSLGRRRRVMSRLEAIYKAEDAKRLDDIGRPALDLSHMRLDDLERILVAVDWHINTGRHRPRRRRRRR
jgi:hypothetical protein